MDNEAFGERPVSWREAWAVLVRLSVYEGPWMRNGGKVCVICGDTAYEHPLTSRIWGCRTCGFTTDYLSRCFHDREDHGTGNGRAARRPSTDHFRVHVRAPRKRVRHGHRRA